MCIFYNHLHSVKNSIIIPHSADIYIPKLVLDVLGVDFKVGLVPQTLEQPAGKQKEPVDVDVPVTYKMVLDVLGVDFSLTPVSLMKAQPHKNQKEDLLMLML